MVIIFFFIALCIAWTVWHFWLIIPLSRPWKWAFSVLYLLCFLSIIPHYALGDRMPAWLAAFTYEAGTSWMIFFLYALLIFLVLSIGRLVHLVPAEFLRDSVTGSCTVIGVIAVLLLYGGRHYNHKYREVIEVKTEKPLDRPLAIVLASDIHAGYHNRGRELSRWVDLINAENPDLVLFAGDILDGEIRPVRHWHYEEIFRKINAPVYACLGNHEYLCGLPEAVTFLESAGIKVLRDSSIVRNGIRIVGRDDRSNPGRKNLEEMAPRDSVFTLLLDHQPYNLEEAELCGVDFQFSGHTHHGQVWPGNWITDAMYEKAFGAHRRGNTQYYVSSGLGIWGGKFRIGTRSEYIVLTVTGGAPVF